MKRDIIEILACQVCKRISRLNVEQQETREIVKGLLYCTAYNAHYPIVDGIPNLLPPDSEQQAP